MSSCILHLSRISVLDEDLVLAFDRVAICFLA